MNKTVTVNIGGIVFHIDENAYERFKQYLESIRMHFKSSEGRDEIMQDIESRIAEMFQERVKNKQVITLQDVEEVTGVMGKPEQFDDDQKEDEKERQQSATGNTKVHRRLYRNPDDKLLGGVCSGIAAYFDIDTVWVRLVVAILILGFPILFHGFGGSAVFMYIVLWFIVPEAKSTTEKLQMRGEPVNISNIEKNVTEEREAQTKSAGFLSRFFGAIGQIIRFFFVFIGKVIAVFLVFIGVVVGFVLFASLLAIFKVPGTHYPVFLDHIFPGGNFFGLGLLGAVLTLGIPFIMLAWLGAKMLFKVKTYPRGLGMAALALWIIGVLICIYVGIRTIGEFSQKQTVVNTINLQKPAVSPLTLAMNESANSNGKHRYWNDDEENGWEEDIRMSIENDQLQSRNIKIDILRSPTDSFKLEERFYARGSSKKDAADRAAKISYTVNQNDAIVMFGNYFTLDKNEKYRAQSVQLVLYVPVGGEIFLHHSLNGYIYDIENTMNIFDSDMLGHRWKMTEAGLMCVDCDGTERTVGGMKAPLPPLPPGKSDDEVLIDDEGIFIKDKESDAMMKIDSNGVYIKAKSRKGRGTSEEDNTILRIDSNGIVIKKPGEKVKVIK